MRVVLATVLLLNSTVVCAAEPQFKSNQRTLNLNSARFVSGILMRESADPVYGIRLCATVGGKFEGDGFIELDVYQPKYDEFGDEQLTGQRRSPIRLACRLKFVKGNIIFWPRAKFLNMHGSIEGPKIKSRLVLVRKLPFVARLLIYDEEGELQYVIPMGAPLPSPAPPSPFLTQPNAIYSQ